MARIVVLAVGTCRAIPEPEPPKLGTIIRINADYELPYLTSDAKEGVEMAISAAVTAPINRLIRFTCDVDVGNLNSIDSDVF